MANLINGTLIDLLLSAAETYKNETCRTLEQYRKDRDLQKRISERYKDENEYFNEQQSKLAAIAREGISKAERVFNTKIIDYTKQMEEQLRKHLHEPVNTQFREKLSMLADFGISPERIEIEDLLLLNNGNQLGLSALDKTLKLVDSPYVLHYHTTADYQNDIAIIRDMTRNIKYIPTEYHQEGCEIYRGITADYIYSNGSIIGGGMRYDSVSLIQCAVSFENNIESIKAMKNIWQSDCSYEEADRNGDPAEHTETAESGTRIEDNPDNNGMNIAKQLGKDAAKARDVYSELVEASKIL